MRSAELSRRRRGGSAAILGERAVDCDVWRGREATGEAEVERTGGAVRERRVAGKRRAAVGSARPCRNRGGERRERELIDSNSNFAQTFLLKHGKL